MSKILVHPWMTWKPGRLQRLTAETGLMPVLGEGGRTLELEPAPDPARAMEQARRFADACGEAQPGNEAEERLFPTGSAADGAAPGGSAQAYLLRAQQAAGLLATDGGLLDFGQFSREELRLLARCCRTLHQASALLAGAALERLENPFGEALKLEVHRQPEG